MNIWKGNFFSRKEEKETEKYRRKSTAAAARKTMAAAKRCTDDIRTGEYPGRTLWMADMGLIRMAEAGEPFPASDMVSAIMEPGICISADSANLGAAASISPQENTRTSSRKRKKNPLRP